MRYRVQYIQRTPHWVMVEADSSREAKAKFLRGDVVEGTQDSGCGDTDYRTILVEKVEP